jgi:hypothetical protein
MYSRIGDPGWKHGKIIKHPGSATLSRGLAKGCWSETIFLLSGSDFQGFIKHGYFLTVTALYNPPFKMLFASGRIRNRFFQRSGSGLNRPDPTATLSLKHTSTQLNPYPFQWVLSCTSLSRTTMYCTVLKVMILVMGLMTLNVYLNGAGGSS